MTNPFEAAAAPPQAQQNAVVAGSAALFYLRAVELFLSIASFLLFRFAIEAFGSDVFLSINNATTVVWLVCSIAGLVLLIQFAGGRRGTAAEHVALTAVILACFALLFELLFSITMLTESSFLTGGDAVGRSVSLLSTAVALAFDITFWIALSRSQSGAPSWLGPAFISLRVISVLLTLPNIVLDYEVYRTIFREGPLSFIFTWMRFPLSVCSQIIVLVMLRRLMSGTGTGGAPSPMIGLQAAAIGPSGTRDMVVGTCWLAGGLIITLFSYAAAASSSTGSSYVVTTGAIVYGLFRLIRGFTKLGSAPRPY